MSPERAMIADMPRLGSDLPLFARDSELRALGDALAAAGEGRPATVLVSGDAGVGKSRLLHDFLSGATEGADVIAVTGHCLDTAESVLPYLPFAEAVGELARRRPELVAAHPGLRPLVPGHAQHPDSDHGRLGLFEALHAALVDLAADATLILALEDLHWADRSSRDLLAFLTSRLSGQKVLILGTYRSDAIHRAHPLRPLLAELVRLPAVQRLQIDPFNAANAADFVRELNGGLDEESIAKIAAASEGNAFLAEELAAAETHTVTFELAEVLIARLERLPESAQQVIRLASVMGRHFTYKRLNAAVWSLLDETGIKHERELDTALRAAISHGIIVQKSASTYAFRHALLGEAVYNDLLPGERTRYHERIAASLAADTHPGAAAELAHHADAAGDCPTALAASVTAAWEADDLAAPAESLLHLERALLLWKRVPEADRPGGFSELRLTQMAGAQAEASGEYKRGLAYSSAAVTLADREDGPVQSAATRRKYAKHLLNVEGNEREAHRIAVEAWELVKDDEPHPTKAWTQAILARTFSHLRDYPAAADWARQAIATADAIDLAGTGRSASHPAARADSMLASHRAAKADAMLTVSSVVYRQGGDLDEQIAIHAQVLELVQGTGWHEVELRAHFTSGLFHVESARIPEALEHFDRGMDMARRTGHKWSGYGLETAVRQVICNYMVGRWDAADAAGEMASSVMPGVVLTRLAAAMLLLDVARGRFEAADRRLDYLADRWQVDGQVLALAGQSGTELDRWRGKPAQAYSTALRTVERIKDMDGYQLAGVAVCVVGIGAAADLAQLRRREGDAEGAKDAAGAGERLAEQARLFVKGGRPLSGSMGPEGLAWIAQLDAEESRLSGDGDPVLWRRVIEAFGYETSRPATNGTSVLKQRAIDASGLFGDGETLGAKAMPGTEIGEPYRRAYAQWRLAEALLSGSGGGSSTDERTEAAEVLREAKTTAMRLGAAPLSAELCALGERSRLDVAVPTSSPLTPRELAVLRLVARGLTNRQIGAELFISEKTVSVHLSRAMSKLKAANRTEAVNVAHLRGYLTEV
ncbi:helix-turn-helix transcriptional regulator [Glycomyces buryatensis]|uniref:LuxR family transcriptional regulator n=1 Tax=Glycomyces buryatensis TaxID=2570927 RepID=A0A4S8Q805_9ACTN|nr:helix-turn-helix transcriptional regulator [Glycomyces buryatensis]THV40497.1 LuxR family transcriptional regulator [Glycomyces buryatensis]